MADDAEAGGCGRTGMMLLKGLVLGGVLWYGVSSKLGILLDVKRRLGGLSGLDQD